jgi:predicted DNA-binding transcriptional regulator YafY
MSMLREPRRIRRKVTARELAERFGVSERTVQRSVAEERTIYEARANERRVKIIELHRAGHTRNQIAQALGVTPPLVSIRLREAREAGLDLSPIPDPDDAD